ncbi:MAG: hypothetical protein BroJett015_07950 [Chloroflexota bacterium]|nr:Uma2 family endonuclease [Ardenticatenaceae bacterium]GIK55132.1 MAG: hypothetical protein BroJett015_07950 [Chloroflexota bacterium]
MTVQVKRHLISVERYDQMIAAGIIQEDERLELLGGEIIEMSPIGIPHAACVKRLNRLFSRKLDEQVIIGVQDPIHIDQYSEPQPDIVVLNLRDDYYAGGHPEPEDILLLVEVADTSLAYDREEKLPRYAQAGIVEVWIVNLIEQQIEVYLRPSPQGYQQTAIFNGKQTVIPVAFPQLTLKVSQILG